MNIPYEHTNKQNLVHYQLNLFEALYTPMKRTSIIHVVAGKGECLEAFRGCVSPWSGDVVYTFSLKDKNRLS